MVAQEYSEKRESYDRRVVRQCDRDNPNLMLKCHFFPQTSGLWLAGSFPTNSSEMLILPDQLGANLPGFLTYHPLSLTMMPFFLCRVPHNHPGLSALLQKGDHAWLRISKTCRKKKKKKKKVMLYMSELTPLHDRQEREARSRRLGSNPRTPWKVQ